MALELNGTAQEIFDSLPYYDNDLEIYPALKQKVEQELARETKHIPQTLHPGIPPPITLFENNPLLSAELKRVESHQPIAPLDNIRYQLPAPSVPASDEEWQKALNNAKAQLEHQRIRQTNIALLQNYGANAWRVHNYLLEDTAKSLDKALEQLQERTTELNRERKNSQIKIGDQLTSLETRWTELISNVLQIELANVALEAEVSDLAKRETELSTF